MARIGVAATAPFGADVLERLAERHEIAFVLTRPDAAQGRGRKTGAPPAKATAERLGLPVLQPERLDVSVELPAETVVAVAYGLLVPPALLDRHTWLNVHPSLLPRWRGAAPVERAIMAGDEKTGVTIIRLVEALDAGPVGAHEAFPIGPEDDAGAVYERAAEVAAQAARPAAGVVRAAGRRRRDVRGQDRSRRSPARPLAARPTSSSAVCARSRRTSAPAQTWTAARSRSGAPASPRTARSSRSRCSRRAAAGWTMPPGSAASADGSLARPSGRLRGRPARLRAGRVRRPRVRDGRGRPRRPRPRARAADRLRHRPARARARPRHRGARAAAGRQARPTGTRRAAHGGLPGRATSPASHGTPL